MLFALIFITLNAIPSLASAGPLYAPGRLLVKVDNNQIHTLNATAQAIGAKSIRSFSVVSGLNLYEFDENIKVEEVKRAFLENPAVLYAEPDYYYSNEQVSDPEYVNQWALENSGQTGGLNDVDINAEKMWQISTGSKDVVIGIIDTGVDYNHPDLQANLWRNPGEIPGNGRDDDGNGYSDDIYGLNAIKNNGDPFDDNMHGTHVAGTIGAATNNDVGVAGVAQQVQMASCKFLNAGGSGVSSDAVECMEYFAKLKRSGINIIATNNSWGGGSASQSMSDAIKTHEELGILFIAAAGNESNNNDVNPRYPCNYPHANVVSVAATDHKDRLASFSNYGKKMVHVAAPGVDILSTLPNNRYGELSGTSMAAPHVSGLAAVIAAHDPSLEPVGIKNLLITGGQKIAAAKDTTISGRRIRGADENGVGSLTCHDQVLSARTEPSSPSVRIGVGEKILLSASAINCAEAVDELSLYDDGQEAIILRDDGKNGDEKAGDGIVSLLWQASNAGSYSLDFGNNDIVQVVITEGEAPVLGEYQADDSVAFEYETIQGQRLNAKDESVHWLRLPFPVHFANDEAGFTDLYVSTNGTISFTDRHNPGHVNQALPTQVAETLVAVFWDDLTTSKGDSDIYVDVVGQAPHRKVVIEWWKVRHYRSSGSATFQAVLYEDSADIRLNFLDSNLSHTSYNYGASATVGVQTDQENAEQYSYQKPEIRSRKSILFSIE